MSQPLSRLVARSLAPLVLVSASLGAQAFDERSFPAANAVSKDEFRTWPYLRELADGSILVVDPTRQRLARVNFTSGKIEEMLRVGAEENEFRTAGPPWAWRGDSSAVLDAVKGRLMILAPDGQFARAVPFGGRGAGAPPGGAPPAAPLAMAGRGGGGGRRVPQPRFLVGEFVFVEGSPPPTPPLPPGVAPPRLPLPIYRMSLNGRGRDSVGQYLPIASPRPALGSSSTGTRTYFVPSSPLLNADVWAAYDDGSIAIVRGMGYRVDFHAIDGERLRSDSIPYPQIAVTDKDRKNVVRMFRDSTAEALRTSAERLQTSSVVYEEPASWPAQHPPFRGDIAPVVGPGDLLWLPVRCTKTEDAQCYDVLDRNAKRVARWQLPAETYVVAFGKGVVYTYNRAKRGGEKLQRHPLP